MCITVSIIIISFTRISLANDNLLWAKSLFVIFRNSNVGDLEVKVRNNDGTVEIRKVIERTIARNYTQWFQEDGFNLGLLRLEPSNSVSQPLTFNASSCLGSQTINKSKNRRCFVVNLIKRDDR